MSTLPVVSAARKLIIQVPHRGVIAQFPEGAVISDYGQNNDEPAVVVFNASDNGGTWQGADADEGVIIINEVDGDVAALVLDIFPSQTVPVESILGFLAEEGFTDQYTTNRQFVDEKLSRAGRMIGPYTGIVKRDDRDVCQVWRDASGTIWRQLGEDVNHIEEDILLRTYVQADGSNIEPDEIPVN